MNNEIFKSAIALISKEELEELIAEAEMPKGEPKQWTNNAIFANANAQVNVATLAFVFGINASTKLTISGRSFCWKI